MGHLRWPGFAFWERDEKSGSLIEFSILTIHNNIPPVFYLYTRMILLDTFYIRFFARSVCGKPHVSYWDETISVGQDRFS